MGWSCVGVVAYSVACNKCAEAQRLLQSFEALQLDMSVTSSPKGTISAVDAIVDFSSSNLRDDQVRIEELFTMHLASSQRLMRAVQVEFCASRLCHYTSTCDFSRNMLSADGASMLCKMLQVGALPQSAPALPFIVTQ